MWEQDTDDLLGRVRVPTLIVATRSSPSDPDAAGFERAKQTAAQAIRAIGIPASFEWIEGIHDVPLQRPEAVARRISMFSRTASRVRTRRS